MAEMNLQVLLRRRPQGEPAPEDFEIVETPLPQPRGRGAGPRPLPLARPLHARPDVGREELRQAGRARRGDGRPDGRRGRRLPRRGFAPGDTVLGGFGWQRFSAVPPARLFKIDPEEAPLSASLGVLGMPGLTAWVGLEDIGQPKAGETVVVSAASGAVGQVVGQIAKLRGCKVVGIAGGGEVRFRHRDLGFDACLDHRGDLDAQLDAACPEGIDVYWENVGGAVQAAVFPRLRDFGRMVMCGMISQYNDAPGADASGAPPGPNLGPVVRKRLRIQGFIVSDTGWPRYPPFRAEMLGWMAPAGWPGGRMWCRGCARRPAPSSACWKGTTSASWW